ncbi:MAG: HPr family phosphocarrier protein [Alistipes sp.]|nr:HPr family phosphocarrier protein [Alistipes sp.]
MLSQKVVLTAPNRMHARPAGDLVKLVKSLDGKILFATAAKEVSASSILALLSLGLKCGTEFEVRAEGGSEQENLQSVISFIENIKE